MYMTLYSLLCLFVDARYFVLCSGDNDVSNGRLGFRAGNDLYRQLPVVHGGFPLLRLLNYGITAAKILLTPAGYVEIFDQCVFLYGKKRFVQVEPLY